MGERQARRVSDAQVWRLSEAAAIDLGGDELTKDYHKFS